MLKNTLKKLSSSSQAKGNKTAAKSSKGSKKDKKKKKTAKKKEEEEIDEDEETFDDNEEFDEDESFGDNEGFDEDEGFGDELDDSLDDDLEDDEGSGKIAEIESRVKDVENEVGQVSSKLNTIRSENEEVGNKISEMEENIRKLLGIYEMVTEGINPFATETGYGGGEGLGIFSTGKESEQEDVPKEVSSKDAEDFFEDVSSKDAEDFFEGDDDNEDEEPAMEVETESIEGGEDFNAGGGAENSESSAEESPEDMFKKLKEEQEQGDQKTEETQTEESQQLDQGETGAESQIPDFDQGESEAEPQVPDFETTVHSSETSENVQEALHETRGHSGQVPKSSSPYLVDIPKDLISDVIALKWMDYLVNNFGIKRMADVLDFYVDIGWISKNVKDLLINYSRGYVLREGHIVEEPENPTLRDHFKSLIFISKLGGHEMNLEEIERLVKEVEELEKDVNEVITEHALGSNC